jgi:glycosyltransferase involved in cell wall biosynthesis
MATRHSIALLVLRTHDQAGVDDVLRRVCDIVEEVEIAPVGPSFAARLSNRLRLRAALLRGMPTWAAGRTAPGFGARLAELVRVWRPDVVQLEYRIMGQFLSEIGGSAPCVLVDLDPVMSEGGQSALLAPLEVRAWKSLGRAVSRQVASLVVLTERDRATVSELSGSTPVARIPLGYDLPDSSLDPAGTDSYSTVCIGSFIHPPNIDAAVWLARKIFPSVRARVPAASLQLIGSNPPSAIHALEGSGVTVQGEVHDVMPFLDAAAVVAAPIRLGAGMRVKVLEALASGKAVVATPLALAGLEVRDGEHVLVAETAAEFADALVELLTDVHRRTAIAKAARRWAEHNLDLDLQVQAYEALYEEILG